MATPTHHVLPITTVFTDTDMKYDVQDTSKFEPADGTGFREKLGELWAKQDGGYEENHTYEVDRLPQGYEVVKVKRKAKRGKKPRYDYYIWGHGVGVFDRVGTFFWHFLELMEYNDYYQLHVQDHRGFACNCRNLSWRGRVGRWMVDAQEQAPLVQPEVDEDEDDEDDE